MAERLPCCEQQVSLAKKRSCWMLGLEKVPQITDFIFISFFLESCKGRHSPHSFVAFSTAFTNPEVEVFIQVWTRAPSFVCMFFLHRYRLMLWEQHLFLRYFEAEPDQISLCLHSFSWSILHQMIAVRGSINVLNWTNLKHSRAPTPVRGAVAMTSLVPNLSWLL